ncbi:unnamed protein product [Ranitomeya imitator]|uniref:Uncharacterized protein n=1 Tax=Ranitomeya imitator TaxID=111125 RepID=A0ABN9KRQ4_9NEOB|nr:unnamed protein product [Ranitomeya imitator]
MDQLPERREPERPVVDPRGRQTWKGQRGDSEARGQAHREMDTNNHPGGRGGLGGIFGGSPGYSQSDLAGVPLTGMSPLSPYLNVDPRYLVQEPHLVQLMASVSV